MPTVDWVRLERLPASVSDLHRIIVSTYPHWAGSEPLTLKKGARSRTLRVSLQCAECGQEMERSPSGVFIILKNGGTQAFCSKVCVAQSNSRRKKMLKVQQQLDVLKLERMPATSLELQQKILAAFPQYAGPRLESLRGRIDGRTLLVSLSCAQCGAEAQRSPGWIRKAMWRGVTQPSCSRACADRSRTIERPAPEVPRLDILPFPTLPTTVESFYQQVIQALPEWAGSKPGTLKCSRPMHTLRFRTSCKHCNKEVLHTPGAVKGRIKKNTADVYCSPRCVTLGQEFLPRRTNCETCGGPMSPLKASGAKTKALYCSKICRPRRYKLQETACKQCNTTFQPKSSRAQFCSRNCADAAHSSWMVGPRIPVRKEGSSFSAHFRLMRPLIIDRDRVCRVCQEWKPRMPIHHLDENPANNDPSNLILLCPAHHIIHHKSKATPYPWFAEWTAWANRFMASKWHEQNALLQAKYLPQ